MDFGRQAPVSMVFSRQEYWNGLPFPPPGDPPDPGNEPDSLTSSALANQLFSTSGIWEALRLLNSYQKTEIPGRNKKKVQLKRSTYPKQSWWYFGVRTHKPHCEHRANTGFSFPHLPVH